MKYLKKNVNICNKHNKHCNDAIFQSDISNLSVLSLIKNLTSANRLVYNHKRLHI